MAIQYGMPLHEFWHGDMRLLEAYARAYYRDRSYTAWLNGAREFEAHSKAISNGNRAKKSDPVLEYSDWQDPWETLKPKEKTATPQNIDEAFLQQREEQQNWLFGR